jgi:hypothetical protein
VHVNCTAQSPGKPMRHQFMQDAENVGTQRLTAEQLASLEQKAHCVPVPTGPEQYVRLSWLG